MDSLTCGFWIFKTKQKIFDIKELGYSLILFPVSGKKLLCIVNILNSWIGWSTKVGSPQVESSSQYYKSYVGLKFILNKVNLLNFSILTFVLNWLICVFKDKESWLYTVLTVKLLNVILKDNCLVL